MTTSDVGSLLRKSAAALDRPGLELEHPWMKVVTVKFGRSKGKWMGIKSDFLWELGFLR